MYRVSTIFCTNVLNKSLLHINNVKFGHNCEFVGKLIIDKSFFAECILGNNIRLNGATFTNPIGRNIPCILVVRNNASLVIGNNVGISSTALFCSKSISIGDNVKIGGNTVIYDTDFHSLNFFDRLNNKSDIENTKSAPVSIGNNVFIGAHTTILKGVNIGENSIVGACSVVSKSIPPNEVWAGNPVKFISSL